MHLNKNNLFKEPFNNITSTKARAIVGEIESQQDEYFERIPVEEFAAYLISKYEMDEFPELIWEETQIDIKETEIIGRDLPQDLYVSNPNNKFKCKVVEFNVPIEGNWILFKYRQSNVFSSGVIRCSLSINNKILCFSFIDYYDNPSNIELAFNQSKDTIISKVNGLKYEFDEYNKALPVFVNDEIRKRIQKIKHTNDYISKFKYPVKKKDIPTAFVSPRIVKKRKITPKPIGSTKSLNNQRFITNEDYMHILGLLQDCGKNWEHHPEIYKGKGEEALRDQLIFVLAPNIEGVVAGEAYNKKGKTDIAIKHESTNLFIGECKIWKGPKGFSQTIDQILGYLSWRDSKAAIMMFVPNQDISNVINSAEEEVLKHPNFVRILDKINEGWTNYRFHLENDPGTYLTLAIQLYHLPGL